MHATDFLRSVETLSRIAAIRGTVEEGLAGGTIAIVGSAALPQKCARAVLAAGGKVVCFIEYDARSWGRRILDIPVVSPAEALVLAGRSALVVVGIWSPRHRYGDTKRWLSAFGFRSVLPVSALFWVLSDRLGPHYQLAPPEALTDAAEAIRAVHDRLADAESRRQFVAHLAWRVSLDPSYIVVPDRHRVYFDPALFRIGPNCRIVDCGAFDGDSLRSCLYWTGGVFGRFDAFEPDPISYARLAAFTEELDPEVSARITPVQAALGATEGTILIAATGMPGSRSAGLGVEARRLVLDRVFADRPVAYLKFDIEGAEWEALEGAQRIIARDRPTLAVAIYHRPTDIFALPAALMARTERYRYFMRTHDDDGIDVVFYAVPEERLSDAASAGSGM